MLLCVLLMLLAKSGQSWPSWTMVCWRSTSVKRSAVRKQKDAGGNREVHRLFSDEADEIEWILILCSFRQLIWLCLYQNRSSCRFGAPRRHQKVLKPSLHAHSLHMFTGSPSTADGRLLRPWEWLCLYVGGVVAVTSGLLVTGGVSPRMRGINEEAVYCPGGTIDFDSSQGHFPHLVDRTRLYFHLSANKAPPALTTASFVSWWDLIFTAKFISVWKPHQMY